MHKMIEREQRAYNWAIKQRHGSVGASYGGTLARYIQDERAEVPEACVWECCGGEHDYYDTSRGEAFSLTDGAPADNGMKFCPYCGGRIVEKTNEDSG